MEKPRVMIIMGSDSDLPQMAAADAVLRELGIDTEVHISSAHRTPERTHTLVEEGEKNGVEVFIAAAGGAAHLAGVVAATTALPVIGVPISTQIMGGIDSLLSTVQMPPGIPVATVAVGGAKNAGILAAQMLSLKYDFLKEKLADFRKDMGEGVQKKDRKLQEIGVEQYLVEKKK